MNHTQPCTTVLSLASKQIWPQVLSVLHTKPRRLLLLHSEDARESKQPAQRLQRFFDKSGLVPSGGTSLHSISGTDFKAIEDHLDQLQKKEALQPEMSALNFTGGNKLMAAAAFRWAAEQGMRAFYLERGNQLTWFAAQDGQMQTRTEALDGNLANHLDPVALLCCQLDASELERRGENVCLNDNGNRLPEDKFFRQLTNGAPADPWLKITGTADDGVKKGDALELTTAAALLKLGVKRVQRSLRLKVKSLPGAGTRLPHAEIDLLFTWRGRLWLVDCKDRKPAEDLVQGLRDCLSSRLNENARQLLDRIEKELRIGQTKVLKEDLLAVREAGGLLGNVICVRKSELPPEVEQYARHNGISIIHKNNLVDDLQNLLHPHRPASPAQLEALTRARTAARS